MAYSITTNRAFPYVLKRHRAEPNPPTFRLRAMSSRIFLELKSLLEEDEGRAMLAVAQIGIVDIEGAEVDGVPLKITPAPARLIAGVSIEGGVTLEVVDMLPVKDVVELATEILRQNTLTTETAKN